MSSEKKVLLVDDEDDFRTLMSFWLKSKGYAVTSVSNGKDALTEVEKSPPDIVFLDLNMPGMDGIEVLKAIRNFDKEVPVIIISAHVDQIRIKEAEPFGVSGVFYKGERFEEGLALLQVALKTHKKLKD